MTFWNPQEVGRKMEGKRSSGGPGLAGFHSTSAAGRPPMCIGVLYFDRAVVRLLQCL